MRHRRLVSHLVAAGTASRSRGGAVVHPVRISRLMFEVQRADPEEAIQGHHPRPFLMLVRPGEASSVTRSTAGEPTRAKAPRTRRRTNSCSSRARIKQQSFDLVAS